MRKKLFVAAVAAAFLAGGGTSAGVALAASTDNPPVCQRVSIQENSGNGPNYPIEVCNSGGPALTRLPKGEHWVFIVDGGGLPEHNHRIVTIVQAEVAG